MRRLWSQVQRRFDKVDPHLARMSPAAKIASVLAATGWLVFTVVLFGYAIWEADGQAGLVPLFGLIYLGLTVGAIWLLDTTVRSVGGRFRTRRGA